ncbi:hypothetical protein K3495_g2890 [Podosphaera aphanis]|nr:hypothetical protein K3495_g2890 [Podosphaera aphanis]
MAIVTRSNTSMIASYSSLDKATQEEEDFAKNNVYCLRIQRTNTAGNKAGGEPKSRILSCVHSGRPTDQPRSRSTTSLRENCPFRLQISKAPEAENMWSLITNPNHNRKAADPLAQRAAIHLLLNTLSNRFRSKYN